MTAELESLPIEGVDLSNDSLFYTHMYEDETSQFDPHPSRHWNHGCECYEREYKCRMPLAFKDCEELQGMFVEWMIGQGSRAAGFWVD